MPRFLAFSLCLLLPAVAFAHVVVTKDGTKYEGRIVEDNDEQVVIETTFEGKKTIKRADIKSVNSSVPPLMDQFEFRRKKALNDAKGLYGVYKWGKSKGFKLEHMRTMIERIIKLDPQHKKARLLLGHEKVDGRWMSPAAKKQYLVEKQSAEMKAKGLVLYKGEWVTPEERDAREKGLLKDGSDWVTEEEFHRRRGEVKRDGKWVKLGLKEGQLFRKEARAGSRVAKLAYVWGPHFDVVYDVGGDEAKKILKSAEKAFGVMRSVLGPKNDDFPEDGSARVTLFLINKLPSYVKVATWYAKRFKVEEVTKGWTNAIRRQHTWWWVQDHLAVSAYKFPNISKTFRSNVIHYLGHLLLTRYRMNYEFPSQWLLKGFSYFLEMEANGYSLTFSLGRGGTTVETGENTDKPAFGESGNWRRELKKAVVGQQDPPLRRIAKMKSGQFRYIELVKSWSVVECLVRWDRDRFKKFIDLSKEDDITEEQALKQAYGTGYRGVDKKWRAYVQAGYSHKPPAPPADPGKKK